MLFFLPCRYSKVERIDYSACHHQSIVFQEPRNCVLCGTCTETPDRLMKMREDGIKTIKLHLEKLSYTEALDLVKLRESLKVPIYVHQQCRTDVKNEARMLADGAYNAIYFLHRLKT